ncbi:TolC family protein [bacterium]|nr:TolC family protein [bacterium]
MKRRRRNKPIIGLSALFAAGIALLVGAGAAAAEDSIPVKDAPPPPAATDAEGTVTLVRAEASEDVSADKEAEGVEYLLTAQEIIALALENSYDLRVAQKDAESAFFEYVKYTGMAGPSVNIAGSISRAGPVQGFSAGKDAPEIAFQKETTSSIGARFSYPLSPMGNLGYGKRAAWSGYQARLAGVDQARAQTITDAFSAYVRYLTAQNAVAVAEEGLALAEEQLRNATLKFDNGMAPRFEVMLGEVAVSQANEELIQARNGQQLAETALYLTMGVVPEDYFAGAAIDVEYAEALNRSVGFISDDLYPKLDADELADAFVERTPTYHALESTIGMLHNQVLAYRRSPQFSLDAGYQQQTGSSFVARRSWSFGISGVFNLWDSGKTEGTQKSFAAQAEGARVQLAQYRQAFRLSLQDAVSNLDAAIQGYTTAVSTLESAEEALRMARLGYAEGVIAHADLVSARTAYLGAELNEFGKRMAVLTSYQSLLQTLGIGDEELYLPTTTSDLSAIVHEVINDESG